MVNIKKATAFDHVRFVFSTLLLLFSMVVTFYAIIMQKTGFWHSVPGYAALIIFIVDLFILGIVEGLQIALVELKRQHPDAYKRTHPAAYRLGLVAAKGDNVERFLMGRQVFVVVLVFFCAKLTTIKLEDGEGFLFPAPYWVQAVFLESGILSCLVVVIIAQLMPQIVAAKYPVHFLQFFIMRPAYYCCTFVELTGLTHACWLLSAFMEFAAGMKDDETTINPNDIENVEDVLDRVEAQLDKVETEDSSSDNEDSTRSGSESDGSDSRLVHNKPESPHTSIDTKGERGQFSKLVRAANQAVSEDALRVVKHYLDTHPEKYSQFPSVIGNKMYPSPMAVAQQVTDAGHEVPRFLRDISDPEHVPPHIVACELLTENKQLREEIELLRRKMQAV